MINCADPPSLPMTRSASKLLHLAALAAGLALFVYLIYRTGLSTLAHHLKLMGWGFAVIVGLSAIRNCVRAGSWYFAIAPDQRTISFLRLINVMLAGEAIKYLSSTGPFVAEPAKVAMARRHVPLMQGFSSVFAENLIYYSTVFVFMVAGLPAFVWLVDVPEGYRRAGYIILAGLLAVMILIWLSVSRRWYPLARALELHLKAHPHRTRVATFAERLREVESSVYHFYEQRRAAFAGIFLLNMGAHFLNVVEVYAILALFGLPSGFLTGFLVEAVTKIVNFAFFFIPTQAGVYESAHALVIGGLGMTASAGLALGVVRKLRALFWAAYGLVALLVLGSERKIEDGG